MTPVEIQAGSGRILDPIDRNSEIMFGLFMVLTFTGTLSVATAGREEVRTMLFAAIGCNIAWGLVDAVMYVLRGIVTRGRQAILVRAVRAAARPEDAYQLIANNMSALAEGMGATEFEHVRKWIIAGPPQEESNRPTAEELRGALGVFLLVFASTFPVVMPFLFTADVGFAKRLSAVIAIAMLFLCGHNWGRYAGMPPVWVGVTMVLLGSLIEAIIILLGG